MRPSYALSRFRLSSIALAFALLFALAGLYAVDRALSQSSRNQVQVEAAESGALVEGFIAVHAEALQSIRGLYLDTTRSVNAAYFHSLVSSMTAYATSFRRIWITDTTGRITEQHLFGTADYALPDGLDIDTTHAFAMNIMAQKARRTRQPQISRPGQITRSESGVILVQPMYLGDRFLGFAGGAVTSAAILSKVVESRPQMRGHLVILAGNDTVAATEHQPPFGTAIESALATVHTPGGGTWRLIVTQTWNYGNVRILLWSIGLATLGALIVVLLHERRQSERLAERSSELERLSVELLRANRAKSEFLANVSHELRTPLNAIVGFVELLRDGVYGDLGNRQIAPVDRIASSAGHLRQLVDQILDLAKMAAGRLEMHLEAIDLRPFVLNVASEIEALVSEKGLNLSIAVSASLPRVYTDPLHLRQILMNLLGNAIKFTYTGGIAIRARLVGARPGTNRAPPPLAEDGAVPALPRLPTTVWIALQVADSGIGIAPADRERIFEEFEQVNAGPRSDSIQRGTGLGLSISRRLARLLGGDLTVESELTKGSTFTVWLPINAMELGPVAANPSSAVTSDPVPGASARPSP